MKLRKHALALVLSTLTIPGFAAPAAAATTYAIDRNHSDVSFQIRHMVSQVRGVYNDFSGTIVRDVTNPAASSVEFTIQAASIDTGVENRNNHLRSADFFDVEKFPTITFKSKKVEKVSDTEYRVTGDFTMHGVTKELALPVQFDGEVREAEGKMRAGFSTSTTLNRKDFGIVWNKTLDGGGVLLADEVKISISIAAKQSS
jgi:polyisoprenoid-binding protein YceI